VPGANCDMAPKRVEHTSRALPCVRIVKALAGFLQTRDLGWKTEARLGETSPVVMRKADALAGFISQTSVLVVVKRSAQCQHGRWSQTSKTFGAKTQVSASFNPSRSQTADKRRLAALHLLYELRDADEQACDDSDAVALLPAGFGQPGQHVLHQRRDRRSC
jgi:hypothetical protein